MLISTGAHTLCGVQYWIISANVPTSILTAYSYMKCTFFSRIKISDFQSISCSSSVIAWPIFIPQVWLFFSQLKGSVIGSTFKGIFFSSPFHTSRFCPQRVITMWVPSRGYKQVCKGKKWVRQTSKVRMLWEGKQFAYFPNTELLNSGWGEVVAGKWIRTKLTGQPPSVIVEFICALSALRWSKQQQRK